MTTISSCTPEENDDVKPSMTFSADNGGIIADKTVDQEDALLFKISAIQNPNTKKNLQSLTIKSFKDNLPNIDTTVTINAESYLGTFNFTATNEPVKEEKFTFTLTDKAGETETKTITITTTAGIVPNPISSHIDVIMLGAQSNLDYGSYLDAHEGTVYEMTPAIASPEKIDMIYFYGQNATLNNNATLASPTDVTVNGTSGNLALATGLTTKNKTIFEATDITVAEFDAMEDDRDFPTSVTDVTKANNLANNDVIAFKTFDGKIGLIKIKAITITGASSSSTMTIDVKIQK